LYAWGSNKDGQLGLKPTELSALSGGGLGCSIPKRVAIGNSSYARGSSSRKLLRLAASHNNSLLLCRGYASGWAGNDVYQWGHGRFTPSRVVFDGRRGRAASLDKPDMIGKAGKPAAELDFVTVSVRRTVSIAQVAAGRDHFVALDLDGCVYTWGLDTESQSEPGHFTLPRVVEALLPECGGARVSAIAAAANRTCAVTALSELYCWEGDISEVRTKSLRTCIEDYCSI
jgi:alpha-tubulin suppressor-like RCC1 family protein